MTNLLPPSQKQPHYQHWKREDHHQPSHCNQGYIHSLILRAFD
jgi:hypothetical protein